MSRKRVTSDRQPTSALPARLPAALREILARARRPEFLKYLQELLVELCRVETTPNPDIGRMRAAEAQCFATLERELNSLGFAGGRLERKAVNPAIQKHSNYSLLHFTKTARRPEGLSAEETYRGRSNLVYVVPGEKNSGPGQSVALNAHIDVVAPYFRPRVKNGTVYGRGACDDKGPVVGIVAGLKLLSEVMPKLGLRWNKNLVGMFVVEEETGGNGSLSLAMDRDLKRLYDTIMVCECTDLKIYPANRGAVWYRAEIQPPPGVRAFEMAPFIIEEMEKEGAALRAESRHPLFPQRPVQTCHGIIGPYGEHPSRICGEVSFTVKFARRPDARTVGLIQDCLESGLASYVGLYGDKTKVTDLATNQPLVARHYDLIRKGAGFQVDVHGATGHMGAIRERDGAITKMAHLARSLVYSRKRIEAAGGSFTLALTQSNRQGPKDGLVLEGGQGFVPTHRIEEVMDRMRHAANRGAAQYLARLGIAPPRRPVVRVTYEKLHNVAFDGDPDSESMHQAIAAAKDCGFWRDEPIRGWTVSCDARLFATEYPGMQVLTFGPGQLAYAHSDQEQITLDEIRQAAEFLAIFLLRQTGSLT